MPRRQEFSAQKQPVSLKASMPLQLKVAELSESEKEDESGPELDFFSRV